MMEYNKEQGTILAIELTNQCNLQCPQCPQGKLDVPKGFMDRETFKKCLEYCNGYTELNWRGEPLLHPDLIEYIQIAKKVNPSLNLGLHTNGLLMTQSFFEEMADNGLNWIHISLHTKQSCEKYKRVKEWNNQRDNPLCVYAEVDTTQEELQARSFGLADDMFQKYHIANWGGYLTEYRSINMDPEEHAKKCQFVLENRFIAAWNGMINPCCWDYEQLHSLGHVDNFKDIRHTPPYSLCPSCIWIKSPHHTPILMEIGYHGFNIVAYGNLLFALSQTLGHVDLTTLQNKVLKEYLIQNNCYIAHTIDDIKKNINALAQGG